MRTINEILLEQGAFIDLFLILLILITLTATVSLKFKLIFGFWGIRIKFLDSNKIILLTTMSGFLAPFMSGSLAAKTLLVMYYTGSEKLKVLFAVAFEQAFEIFWLITLSSFLAVSLTGWVSSLEKGLLTIIALIGMISCFFLFIDKICLSMLNFKSLIPGFIKKYLAGRGINQERYLDALQEFKVFKGNPKLILTLLIPAVISFFLVGLLVVLFASIFGVHIGIYKALVIFWIPNLLGKVSGLPGGIGSQDISMGYLLTNFGVDAMTSTKIVAAYRLITLSYAFAAGGAVILSEGKRLIDTIWIKRGA